MPDDDQTWGLHDARASGPPGGFLKAQEEIRLGLFVINVMQIIFGPDAAARAVEERAARVEEEELRLIGFPSRYLVIKPVSPGSPRSAADVEEISAAVRVLARHGMLMGDAL